MQRYLPSGDEKWGMAALGFERKRELTYPAILFYSSQEFGRFGTASYQQGPRKYSQA